MKYKADFITNLFFKVDTEFGGYNTETHEISVIIKLIPRFKFIKKFMHTIRIRGEQ